MLQQDNFGKHNGKLSWKMSCWTLFLCPCRLFSWAVMATTWSQVEIMVWWRCGRPVTSNSSTSTLVVMLASEQWTYHTIKGQSRQLCGRYRMLTPQSEERMCTQTHINKWSHTYHIYCFNVVLGWGDSRLSLIDSLYLIWPFKKEIERSKKLFCLFVCFEVNQTASHIQMVGTFFCMIRTRRCVMWDQLGSTESLRGLVVCLCACVGLYV